MINLSLSPLLTSTRVLLLGHRAEGQSGRRTGSARSRAEEALHAGVWADAENLLLNLLERDPTDAGAWISVGNARTEQGDYSAALAAFAEARKLVPESVHALFGSAGVHERMAAWGDAIVWWREACDRLQENGCGSAGGLTADLTRSIHHLAMCEFLAGDREAAGATLASGDQAHPRLLDQPETYMLRARLIRDTRPHESLELLARYLESFNDDAARYDFGSLALEHGRFAEALEVLAASPRLAAGDASFLLLASDLAERSGRWGEMANFRGRLIAGGASSATHREKLQFAYLNAGALSEARAVALDFARSENGELRLMVPLIAAYERAGLRDRARRLARFLRRRWPHSQFSALTYIRLVGQSGEPDRADALLRAELMSGGDPTELRRAYCELALITGRFAEARRRFDWFLRINPDDTGAKLGLGYALASSVGIEAASKHFEVAASETFLEPGALVGLAHMAMRGKNDALAAERWRVVGHFAPSDPTAAVERARALFDMGAPLEALGACRHWIARHPKSRQVEEFHAWLLCATGQFESARTCAAGCLALFGPSWAATQVLVEATGMLGELTPALTVLDGGTPPLCSEADVQYLYSLVRLLTYFGFAQSGLPRLLATYPAMFDLGWAHSYLDNPCPATDATPGAPMAPRARRDWRDLVALVGSDRIEPWRAMSDDAISALLAQRGREPFPVHIVNMFEQASGGSELHALDVGSQLKPFAKVSFWAAEAPHPLLATEHGVRGIDPSAGAFPQGGVILFVGAYYKLGPWLEKAKPKRVLILYNTFDSVRLTRFIKTLHRYTKCRVELLFCSEMMGAEVRQLGVFEPSPTDLSYYANVDRSGRTGFVIGRHSRDVVEKHNPDDWRVYEALINEGAKVELLGASCMASIYPKDTALKLLPARRGGMHEYLASLDCFYYRTGTWIEPWGRVVIEAMAVGLPVVVHERGGYAEVIEHGVDGFVFRTSEEAIEHLQALRRSSKLRARIGAAARRKAEALVGPTALRRLLAYYLMS